MALVHSPAEAEGPEAESSYQLRGKLHKTHYEHCLDFFFRGVFRAR